MISTNYHNYMNYVSFVWACFAMGNKQSFWNVSLPFLQLWYFPSSFSPDSVTPPKTLYRNNHMNLCLMSNKRKYTIMLKVTFENLMYGQSILWLFWNPHLFLEFMILMEVNPFQHSVLSVPNSYVIQHYYSFFNSFLQFSFFFIPYILRCKQNFVISQINLILTPTWEDVCSACIRRSEKESQNWQRKGK